MRPHIAFTVENRLGDGRDKLPVELSFNSMDDFAPEAVAQQVGPLRELLALRTKLADLRSKLQGNDKLDEILQATVRDAERLAQLKTEIGGETRGAEGMTNG
jgi:type VI secretion system protein ImpB